MNSIISRPALPNIIDEVNIIERNLERATIILEESGAEWHCMTPRANSPRSIAYCERACRVVLDSITPETLAHAMQPADNADISERLARLVAAFPNAAKVELDGYGTALHEDVIEMRPSRLQIARACRRLRRNCKFLPTISEVLDELDDARVVEREANHIRSLPRMIQDARDSTPLLEQQISECMHRIEKNDPALAFDRDVIDEACRRLREEKGTPRSPFPL